MIGKSACSGSQAHTREPGDEATDDELIEQIHNFHVLSRWEEEQGILSQCVLSSQLQVACLICNYFLTFISRADFRFT